ncbi:ribosomal protein S12 methylthiotransferase accessory factor [Murinocardiopsis flavida]|uniref:Ribosomal protein S12 methylthiotransferase accessory factor n=1 Tax=Murinocardiopsis flavida TaxID=645275 RepID=A0A2P8DRR6_9ACTN|nr:TOMM precursor leader peptide-binding protein [Murinocardiopsis flavida]PSK99913.1 ribosomal protein S12 methylthiotransferase accessory factor [Murinocardiopsis flavida]
MTGTPEPGTAPGGADAPLDGGAPGRTPRGGPVPGRAGDRARVAEHLRERAERDPAFAGFRLEVAVLGAADALAAAPDASVPTRCPTPTLTATAASTPPPTPAPSDDGTGPGRRAVLSVHLGERSAVAAVFPDAVCPEAEFSASASSGSASPASPADSGAPCPHCLAVRWQKLRPNHQRTAMEQGGGLHAIAADPLLTPFALDTLADLAAVLARRAAAYPRGGALRPGTLAVHELRTDTLRVRAHTLMADPDCPRCGAVSAAAPQDPADGVASVPRPAPKPHPDVYRALPVAEMALPLDALTGPLCGVLGTDADPVLDSTTTAPVTGRIAVRDGPALLDVHWSGHSAVHAHSTLLAVCEGLERCAGLRHAPDRVVASHAELSARGTPAVDPAVCGVLDAAAPALAAGFAAYSPAARMPWVTGRSLRDRSPVLVPEQFVSYTVNDGWPRFAAESSSGSAAGRTLTEAVLHALLERVERDAFLIAWHARARLPEIDAAGCADPATRHMIARLGLIGYDVRFFDTRIDLPIPVVTAVAVRRDGSGDGLGAALVSAGASLDPRQALHTALLEVASNLPGFARRTAERLAELRAMAADFTRVREMRDHSALFGLPEMAPHLEPLLGAHRAVPMAELYGQWERDRPRGLDLADDLGFCRDLLADRGFDTVAVDQTSPEQRRVGLRTARVLVPGMVPIDFGWDRQRVLDMPRTRTALSDAGRRHAPLARSDLHHVPHPFM